MAAKSKRRTLRPEALHAPAAAPSESGSIPRPQPPRPHKRLLMISAILLLAWFSFLGWMAWLQ